MMVKTFLIILAVFFLIHALRDLLQWKYGYGNWFTSVGHNLWPIKNTPRIYELVSMVVAIIISLALLYFAFSL